MSNNDTGYYGEKAVEYFFSEYKIVTHSTARKDEIGIDLYFELFRDDLKGIHFAGQVKSGDSYFKDNDCYVYLDNYNHIYNWLHIKMPVYLFVHNPICKKIYYINAKTYIQSNINKSLKGYVFRFPKESNELTKESLSYIFNDIIQSGALKANSVDKAVYNFSNYKLIAEKFSKEIEIFDEAIAKAIISQWIHTNLWIVGGIDAEIIENVIYFERIGLGLVGFLIDDISIKSITIFSDRIFVEFSDCHRQSFMNNEKLYDLTKIIEYYNKIKINMKNKKGSDFYITFKDYEVIIPESVPASLDIRKIEKGMTLAQMNLNKRIEKENNEILLKILSNNYNVLIIGLKSNRVDAILSSITSLFKDYENILIFESRSDIDIQKGNVTRLRVEDSEICKINTMYAPYIENADRIIFDIGSYTLENYLSEIFDITSKLNNVIIVLGYGGHFFSRYQNQWLIDEISDLGTKIEYNHAKSLIKNIKYIINTSSKNMQSCIQEIWEINNEIPFKLYSRIKKHYVK